MLAPFQSGTPLWHHAANCLAFLDQEYRKYQTAPSELGMAKAKWIRRVLAVRRLHAP